MFRLNWKVKIQRLNFAFPVEKYLKPLSMKQYEKFIDKNGVMIGRNLIDEIFTFGASHLNSIENSSLSAENLKLRFDQGTLSHIFDEKYFTSPLCISIIEESKLLYSIPPRFFFVFSKNNIRINKLGCTLLWNLYISAKFSRQIMRLIKSFLRILFVNTPKKDFDHNILVYGANSNVLKTSPDMLNFRHWCEKSLTKSQKDKILYIVPKNENNLFFGDSIISALDFFNFQFINEFKVLKNILRLFIVAIVKRRFTYIYLLCMNIEEIVLAFRFRLNENKINPDFYYFTSQIGVNKPLWATQLEDEGKFVGLIFLATYGEPPLKNGQRIQGSYWKLSSWRNLFLKDAVMLDYLGINLTSEGLNVFYVNCPDWLDEEMELDVKERKIITIFDSEPQVNYYGLGSINAYGWYRVENAIKFITDIIDVAEDLNVLILIKPKRKQVEKRFPAYSILLDKIKTQKFRNVLLVSENISVRKLCRNSTLVLSRPYSTAGVIALEENRESMYFNPIEHGLISMETVREIPIISSKKQLRQIMLNKFTKNDFQ